MNDTNLGKIPLIYTHFGVSQYLPLTLNAASITNPDRPKYLLGDDSNREVASRSGWAHIDSRK